MRPLFLRRITRTPSLRWFVRRLVNRLIRRVLRIEREPVQTITERDLRLADLSLAYCAGFCTCAIAMLLVFTLFVVMPCASN